MGLGVELVAVALGPVAVEVRAAEVPLQRAAGLDLLDAEREAEAGSTRRGSTGSGSRSRCRRFLGVWPLLVYPHGDLDHRAAAGFSIAVRAVDRRLQFVGADDAALDEQRGEPVGQRVAVGGARRLLADHAVREEVPALDLPLEFVEGVAHVPSLRDDRLAA